ncbi:MAG: hypothetical protein ABW122_11900, partial [Ilumatobacteraceae bacterium]
MIGRKYLGLLAVPALLVQCQPTACAPPPTPVDTTPATIAPAVTTTSVAPPTTSAPTTTVPAPAYSFLFTDAAGRPARWDPCAAPITYEIDGRFGTSEELAAISAAIDAVSRASGHVFELVGVSATGVPARGTDAMVGYTESFTAAQIGEGRIEVEPGPQIVAGQATVKAGLAPDLRRLTLIHELAHVVGLGHVPDPRQVMFASARSPYLSEYAPGDLVGLGLVGAAQPCIVTG